MPSTQIREIQDEELRGLMEQADALLDGGDNTGCVRVCADAYLLLLQKQPQVLTGLQKVLATPRVQAGLETGTLRFAPLMWPRLAASCAYLMMARPRSPSTASRSASARRSSTTNSPST